MFRLESDSGEYEWNILNTTAARRFLDQIDEFDYDCWKAGKKFNEEDLEEDDFEVHWCILVDDY